MTMNVSKPIRITRADHRTLTTLLRSPMPVDAADNACRQALLGELNRAILTPATEMPADVITLNSRVRVADLTTGEALDVTIVLPEETDVDSGKISVLAPLGTALLGFSQGDEIEWPVPAGVRRFRVERVLFQPEAGEAVLDEPAERGA
jgi:regulator of nucleoside diphosphate kinase